MAIVRSTWREKKYGTSTQSYSHDENNKTPFKSALLSLDEGSARASDTGWPGR